MQPHVAGQPLRGGKAVLGMHIPLAAAAGAHWVLIDCGYGPMNHRTVAVMIRAAEWAGMTPVVRPPRDEAPTILRDLAMGAQGVFVPNVQARADAEAAVRTARSYPSGQRRLLPCSRWGRLSVRTPLPGVI